MVLVAPQASSVRYVARYYMGDGRVDHRPSKINQISNQVFLYIRIDPIPRVNAV